MTQDEIDDAQLQKLCAIGAKEYRRDPKVIPMFHIMGCEVDLLKRHMKETYPNVPYKFDYPNGHFNAKAS